VDDILKALTAIWLAVQIFSKVRELVPKKHRKSHKQRRGE